MEQRERPGIAVTTRLLTARIPSSASARQRHVAAARRRRRQDTTPSTSYQTKTTLTFTPATTGDYLVIASAVRASDANGAAMRARLNYVTGSLTWGDKAWYCKDDFDNQAFAVMEKLTLANASQTFRLEYRSESGTLCYIQHARILALRLDAFDNSYFASNHSLQNTTQATDQDFLTLTATPLALSHAIIPVGSYNTVSTSVSAYFNVAKDGSSLAEVVREAPNTAGWQDAGLAQRETPAAVSTTWKWQARAETSGTAVNVAGLAIAVLQLEVTAVRRPVLDVDVLLTGRGGEAELGDAEERDPVLRAARLLDLTGLVEQRRRTFVVPEIDLALVIVGGAGAPTTSSSWTTCRRTRSPASAGPSKPPARPFYTSRPTRPSSDPSSRRSPS